MTQINVDVRFPIWSFDGKCLEKWRAAVDETENYYASVAVAG